MIDQDVRGLNPKTAEFYLNTCTFDADVILLTETWLHEGVSNSELFPACYCVSRCDRKTARGG